MFRSDQSSGCRLKQHKVRHHHWWSFGTKPAHPAKWFLYNKPDKTPGDGADGGDDDDDDYDDDDCGSGSLSSPSHTTYDNVHLVKCGTHLSVWWAGSNGRGGRYVLGVVDHVYPEVPWVRVAIAARCSCTRQLAGRGKCKIMKACRKCTARPLVPLQFTVRTHARWFSFVIIDVAGCVTCLHHAGATRMARQPIYKMIAKFNKTEVSLLEMDFGSSLCSDRSSDHHGDAGCSAPVLQGRGQEPALERPCRRATRSRRCRRALDAAAS